MKAKQEIKLIDSHLLGPDGEFNNIVWANCNNKCNSAYQYGCNSCFIAQQIIGEQLEKNGVKKR